MTARAISAPNSSWRPFIERALPSKPESEASTTTGRMPDAALIALATLREPSGCSVEAESQWSPVSDLTGRASMPTTETGEPPTRLSQMIVPRASAMSVQRSSTGASRSTTAPIT